MGEGSKRLYVGNLCPQITSDELKDKFKKFGEVEGAEVKHKTDIDGNPIQTFGFVNIQISESDLMKCINKLSNSNWKGYDMRVQQAKESFMSRLQKERAAAQAAYNPLSLIKDKLAAEGTPIQETENKIVAKHLGGDKKDPSRKNKKSGNFEKLGKSETEHTGDGRQDEENTSGYNPFELFKKRTDELLPTRPKGKVDEGVVTNGIISFADDANSLKKSDIRKKRKAREYNSSDDESTDVQKIRKNKEQKRRKREKEEIMTPSSREKKVRKEKREIVDEEEVGDDNDETNKNEGSDSQAENIDPDQERKASLQILNEVVDQEARKKERREKKKKRNNNHVDYMPRFDPTVNQADDEEFSSANQNSGNRPRLKRYDIMTNLKSAFNNSNNSEQTGGFSFGFMNQQSQPKTEESEEMAEPKISEDQDADFSTKSGRKLFTMEAAEAIQKQAGQKFGDQFGNELSAKTLIRDVTETFFLSCEKVRVNKLEEEKDSDEYDPLRMLKTKTEGNEMDNEDEVYEDHRIKNASRFFFNYESDHANLKREFKLHGRSALRKSFNDKKRRKEARVATNNSKFKKRRH